MEELDQAKDRELSLIDFEKEVLSIYNFDSETQGEKTEKNTDNNQRILINLRLADENEKSVLSFPMKTSRELAEENKQLANKLVNIEPTPRNRKSKQMNIFSMEDMINESSPSKRKKLEALKMKKNNSNLKNTDNFANFSENIDNLTQSIDEFTNNFGSSNEFNNEEQDYSFDVPTYHVPKFVDDDTQLDTLFSYLNVSFSIIFRLI